MVECKIACTSASATRTAAAAQTADPHWGSRRKYAPSNEAPCGFAGHTRQRKRSGRGREMTQRLRRRTSNKTCKRLERAAGRQRNARRSAQPLSCSLFSTPKPSRLKKPHASCVPIRVTSKYKAARRQRNLQASQHRDSWKRSSKQRFCTIPREPTQEPVQRERPHTRSYPAASIPPGAQTQHNLSNVFSGRAPKRTHTEVAAPSLTSSVTGHLKDIFKFPVHSGSV